jgi:phospho-N-acetylmuramoyl-pentapeptide-transferase
VLLPHHICPCDSIPLRALLAAGATLALTLLWGPSWIRWLKSRFREPIKGDSARLCDLQRDKNATPTMGGLFIVVGLAVGVALCGNLGNPLLQTALALAAGLALVGAVDDLVKLRRKSNGLSARTKLAAQVIVCAVAALVLYGQQAQSADGLALYVPLLDLRIPLGAAFVPWAIFVMVGTSNAVNLTDGLDGLASGCLIIVLTTLAVAAVCGTRLGQAGEMVVLAGAMVGGLIGFLCFNRHPAQVFMGDTGSLPLGGLLGMFAITTQQELLLMVIGGVFVAEAFSVILQVGYYKWRRQRIFLCAPLHHHFQFQGWPENRIVTRFWMASLVCALLGLAMLRFSMSDSKSAPHFPATAMEGVATAMEGVARR